MAKRRVGNGIDVRMELPSDKELEQMFGAVNQLNRYRVLDTALSAGGTIIQRRARELAPRSSVTGTAKKRSKSQKKAADWDTPLWKTIKRVFRKYSFGVGVVIIGPEWPSGNKAYFNTSPSGRKQVLWGKTTGLVKAQIRNWIVQAFDETKPQQLSAMKAALKRSFREIFGG